MYTPEKEIDIAEQIKARLAELPRVVQDAITSADVEKEMRSLADKHKLHIDQWSALENEVQLALLGFQPVEDLPKNIQSELSVSLDEANSLATDINTIVFEPIRKELERQLEHPDAEAAVVSGAETMRQGILSASQAAVLPATPPPPPPTEKAVRAPLSSAYTAAVPSTERKAVEGDPYREPPK